MQVRTWSRVDQVALEGLLWALPAVAVLQVAVHLVRAVRGAAFETSGRVPDDLAAAADLVRGSLSGTVLVEDPTSVQYAWASLPLLLLAVLAVTAAWLLLGVVRSLRTGDPFTTANARRLTALSVLTLASGFALPLVDGIAHARVLEPLLPLEPRSWTVDLQLWVAIPGVLIGFLAEVFSRGARLREDVEGLV